MVVRRRKETESRTLIYGAQLCKKFEPRFLRRFLKKFILIDNPFAAASVVDFGGQTTVITTR